MAFDADGVAMDIPLRYVHGVGRVPAANMPFRDVVTDWMTKCDVTNTEDGLQVGARARAHGGEEGGAGASMWIPRCFPFLFFPSLSFFFLRFWSGRETTYCDVVPVACSL